MTRIFDNITAPLGEHLRGTFPHYEAMDVATGYFNLRGWRVFDDLVTGLIDDEVDLGDGDRPRVRVLIGMLTAGPQAETLDLLQSDLTGHDVDDVGHKVYQERAAQVVADLRQQLQRGRATQQDRRTLMSLRDLLASGRVEIRAYVRRPLHGKAYIFHRSNDPNTPRLGFVGSSNLTGPGLASNYELNVDVLDFQPAQHLAQWFDDRWDERSTFPITAEILDLIEASWVYPKHPYEVFLKVCYDLSRDARESVSQYDLPPSVAGDLLAHQAFAVRVLARKLMTGHRGAMLGDVVGLGKTIVAISVALMLREEAGFLPLVVCPKNLVTMWEKHLAKYDLPGRVVPYSKAGDVLPTLPRYGVVIVDESHTLRNDNRIDYQAVREYIERNASRALLLTATPYNLRFRDVANQLGLYLDPDADLGLSPAAALATDPGLAGKVDGKITTLKAFKLSEEPEDWRRLMSEHLMRRTRSFIEAAADKDERGRPYLTFPDGSRWTFPKRDPRPVDHPFAADDPAAKMVANETLDTIAALALPRYTPLAYIEESRAQGEDEKALIARLKTAGGNVSGFVRTMFYKRLSSCGHSYLLSLRRHVARNELWLHALENGLPVPAGSISESDLGDDEGDVDEAGEATAGAIGARYDTLRAADPKGLTWVRAGLFKDSLRTALEADTAALRELLDWYGPWDQDVDSKLAELVNLLTNVHPEEKVLIFSEYADTAHYVADALRAAGIANVGLATGESDTDPVDVARRFSPKTNVVLGEDGSLGDGEQELRVLVTTDVLSEGANLQQAAVQVNFDIPWAIIRLIQRAGRVDRVLQEADTVVIYSMFHGSLDGVLDLRRRIAGRLAANAAAFGSDEKFFGTDEEVGIGSGVDADTLRQLYAGTLEDPDDIDQVDAASLAYQYWVNATKDDPELAARVAAMPDLVEATRTKRASDKDGGVVCFVRTQSGLDALGYAPDSGAAPYLLTGQEALARFEASPAEPALALRDDHEELVTDLVRGPLAAPAALDGTLRGVRRQVWNRLGNQLDLFDPDVSEAVSAMHRGRLTDDAERRLRASMRSGVSDMDLAVRVGALFREGQLVVESRSGGDPIRIVSSMGVK